jgi:hypothetical protein
MPLWIGPIVEEQLARHLSLVTFASTGPDMNVGRDAVAAKFPEGILAMRPDEAGMRIGTGACCCCKISDGSAHSARDGEAEADNLLLLTTFSNALFAGHFAPAERPDSGVRDSNFLPADCRR